MSRLIFIFESKFTFKFEIPYEQKYTTEIECCLLWQQKCIQYIFEMTLLIVCWCLIPLSAFRGPSQGAGFSSCIEDPLDALLRCLLFGRVVVCLTYSPFQFSISLVLSWWSFFTDWGSCSTWKEHRLLAGKLSILINYYKIPTHLPQLGFKLTTSVFSSQYL